MKTNELTGALLDYWVAIAEGEKAYIRRERGTINNEDGSLHTILFDEDRCFRKRWNEGDAPAAECKGVFWLNYSRNWAHGGPIIERELIELINDRDWREDGEFGRVWQGNHAGFGYTDGDTALIAAMRAFVGSKFGAEVPADPVGAHERKA